MQKTEYENGCFWLLYLGQKTGVLSVVRRKNHEINREELKYIAIITLTDFKKLKYIAVKRIGNLTKTRKKGT